MLRDCTADKDFLRLYFQLPAPDVAHFVSLCSLYACFLYSDSVFWALQGTPSLSAFDCAPCSIKESENITFNCDLYGICLVFFFCYKIFCHVLTSTFEFNNCDAETSD